MYNVLLSSNAQVNLITAGGETIALTKADAWVEPPSGIVHGSYSEVLALQQGQQVRDTSS